MPHISADIIGIFLIVLLTVNATWHLVASGHHRFRTKRSSWWRGGRFAQALPPWRGRGVAQQACLGDAGCVAARHLLRRGVCVAVLAAALCARAAARDVDGRHRGARACALSCFLRINNHQARRFIARLRINPPSFSFLGVHACMFGFCFHPCVRYLSTLIVFANNNARRGGRVWACSACFCILCGACMCAPCCVLWRGVACPWPCVRDGIGANSRVWRSVCARAHDEKHNNNIIINARTRARCA